MFDWESRKVHILGTQYNVILTSNEDMYPSLINCNGYMDPTTKEIVVRNDFGDDDIVGDIDFLIRKNIIHEITHAFLYESGLYYSSCETSHWASNEEMVDWIALQFDKISRAIDTVCKE